MPYFISADSWLVFHQLIFESFPTLVRFGRESTPIKRDWVILEMIFSENQGPCPVRDKADELCK